MCIQVRWLRGLSAYVPEERLYGEMQDGTLSMCTASHLCADAYGILELGRNGMSAQDIPDILWG
eukprot:CAMPEP_0167763348 /NCGR_PEP_ID=MMETSP0110_2-20121227/13311_1 /TAXON_ID=629695 /ORGANISM="Gymnochlora sp., Strain CCMP2014" /LENGTH=63 /DNA_ID=CAMNT_0007650399 /DNA_START=676 /DNA_END=867 /DNA_ORIENTATION=+